MLLCLITCFLFRDFLYLRTLLRLPTALKQSCLSSRGRAQSLREGMRSVKSRRRERLLVSNNLVGDQTLSTKSYPKRTREETPCLAARTESCPETLDEQLCLNGYAALPWVDFSCSFGEDK